MQALNFSTNFTKWPCANYTVMFFFIQTLNHFEYHFCLILKQIIYFVPLKVLCRVIIPYENCNKVVVDKLSRFHIFYL